MSVCIDTYSMSVHMWLETRHWHHVFLSCSPPHFETGSLLEPGAHWLGKTNKPVNRKSICVCPRSRITDWRCTATPGFLQECWGLGSKHHISPALPPTLKWEAFGHHTQNCAAFYLPIAVYSIQPKKRNSQFTLNKGVSPVVLSTTGVRYLFVRGGGGQEGGAPCSTGCLVMGSPQVGSASTTPSSNQHYKKEKKNLSRYCHIISGKQIFAQLRT